LPADDDFLLIRVDDRLLHGQVSLGWGVELDPRTYLIVDDRLAADPVETEIYRAAAPHGVEVHVTSVDGFLAGEKGAANDATVMLLRDVETLSRLVSGGFRPAVVNLGGLHGGGDAIEVLPFLHLRDDDWSLLDDMTAAGIRIYAQDLPQKPRHDWERLRALGPSAG